MRVASKAESPLRCSRRAPTAPSPWMAITQQPADPTAGGHLLGAALVVLAAPLGLRFLLSLRVTGDIWTTVANLVDHLWQNVPRSELHRMETLVEARQAALVVVSIDRTEPEVGRLLEHATACIVTEA